MGVRFLNEKEVDDFLRRVGPRKMKYVSAYTLNDLAFLGKHEIPKVIDRHMTVRNKGFVKTSTRFTRARPGLPIDRQVASYGTIEKKRSTGWIEQQTAGTDKRQRKWTPKARRGGRGTVKGKYRFKPGNKVLKLSSIKGQRIDRLIKRVFEMAHFDKPILVGGSDDIESGVIVVQKTGTGVKFKRIAYRQDERVKRVDILRESWEGIKRDAPGLYMLNFLYQFRKIKI